MGACFFEKAKMLLVPAESGFSLHISPPTYPPLTSLPCLDTWTVWGIALGQRFLLVFGGYIPHLLGHTLRPGLLGYRSILRNGLGTWVISDMCLCPQGTWEKYISSSSRSRVGFPWIFPYPPPRLTSFPRVDTWTPPTPLELRHLSY